MRRLSILIATLAACAVIAATPAVAGEAQAAPAAVPAVAAVAPAAGVHQGWFRDWNACIWGIGVPAGVAVIIARTPQTWASVNRLRSIPGVGWYVPRVLNACGRFIRS
jgi:hypothetical protein